MARHIIGRFRRWVKRFLLGPDNPYVQPTPLDPAIMNESVDYFTDRHHVHASYFTHLLLDHLSRHGHFRWLSTLRRLDHSKPREVLVAHLAEKVETYYRSRLLYEHADHLAQDLLRAALARVDWRVLAGWLLDA